MARATSRLTTGYLFLPLLMLMVMLVPTWKPLSLKMYQLWEPHLALPVSHGQSTEHLRIRSDAYGNGEFGAKRRGSRHHAGIDLLAPLGSPVVAARSGWATTGYKRYGYGHFVTITHPDGSETLYAHLARVDVENGQWVWQDQQLGTVGKTGNAGHYRGILPHLHFEVRIDGEAVNPLPLLAATPAPPWRTVRAPTETSFLPRRTSDVTR